MQEKSQNAIGGITMSFKKKLIDAYNQKVTKPDDYQEIESRVPVIKTHHYLFTSIKISAIVAASLVGVLILTAGGFILASSMHTTESTKSIKKARFSVYDTNLAKSETFKTLNNITYSEEKEYNQIDNEFVNKVNTFAANSFINFNKSGNLAYSPLMLYTQLDLISLAVSDDQTQEQFDNALLSNDSNFRASNINKAMRNNFFVNQTLKSTVQAKNAVFIEEKLGADPAFVEGLTARRAEAYELNFQDDKDVQNILNWASQSVNEENFLKKEDLEIQIDTAMMFLSSLYFDNTWSSKFKTQDTKVDDFYLSNSETIQTKFMNHAYYGQVDEYEKYVAVTDYYNSSYSIQYFVPKDTKDNIFDILPNNFLDKKEESNHYMVSLSLPKFAITSQCKLNEVVEKLGVTNPYVKYSNHLKRAFQDADSIVYSYLVYTKQKTTVSFDEDGTVVKSITFSMGAAGKAGPMRGGYEVKLNQPFVYCIRDGSGLPLLVGTVTNPLG